MGLNFKLIKRTTDTSTSDIMHSNSYAKAQNSGHFGAQDSTTFSERKQIEQRRKFVKGYRNARLARGVNMMPRARTSEEQRELAARALKEIGDNHAENNTRQAANAEREQGGLYKFDARSTSGINRTAQNWGGSPTTQRAARAERFSGKGFGRS